MFRKILFTALAVARLLHEAQAAYDVTGPLFEHEHPDPCIIRLPNGTYYSFADKQEVAMSESTDLRGNWMELPDDTLQVKFDQGGDWTTGKYGGGPDVTQLSGDSFIMYFTGIPKNQGTDTGTGPNGKPKKPKMCIGAATSDNILGPYHAQADPYICGYEGSGTGFIAPSLFQQDGKNYLLYKNGSAFDPEHTSRTFIKQVGDDGVTNLTHWQKIYSVESSSHEFDDEGPTLNFNKGTYFLFYDAGFYANTSYRIDYATSSTLMGTYTYGGNLIHTDTYSGNKITSPGGIDFVGNSSTEFTFMAYAENATISPDGRVNGIRQLHAATLEYSGNTAKLAQKPSTTDGNKK